MLYSILSDKTVYSPLLFAVSFLLVFFSLKYFMKLLPKDHGRQNAFHGELSEGKPRGAGLIIITAFTLCSAVFVPFSAESAIYILIIYLSMLSGFFDDASSAPWGELKKGIIDLILTVVLTAAFIISNGTTVTFFGKSYDMPLPVFALLSMILIWASINVTNCCDGVDGMCGSLSFVTILLFILYGLPADMRMMSDVMIMAIAAYLWFNCSPSRLLMGDAGSRAIGVFLAILALKSGNPFIYIFFASVIIVDGGLGMLKLSFRRFLRMKNFMENIRTPVHDHWRKNLGLGDTQTVTRFVIIQLVIGVTALYLL